jgi:hypothetical protein
VPHADLTDAGGERRDEMPEYRTPLGDTDSEGYMLCLVHSGGKIPRLVRVKQPRETLLTKAVTPRLNRKARRAAKAKGNR